MPPPLADFSDEQWWAMCDIQMSRPVPLNVADLTKPFIYCREFGVFYVGGGRHMAAMTLLLAFQHGELDWLDIAPKLSLEYPYGTSEHWLEHTPGAAVLSSVSKTIEAFSVSNLNEAERNAFAKIRYLDKL